MAQVTVGYSPKFVNTTLVTTALGIALAVIVWVQGNVELLGLNPILSGLLLAVCVPLAAGVTAFASKPGTVVEGEPTGGYGDHAA